MKSSENNFCHPCDTFFETRKKFEIHEDFYHRSNNPRAFIYPNNHERRQKEIRAKFSSTDFNEEEEDENDPAIYLVNIVYSL